MTRLPQSRGSGHGQRCTATTPTRRRVPLYGTAVAAEPARRIASSAVAAPVIWPMAAVIPSPSSMRLEGGGSAAAISGGPDDVTVYQVHRIGNRGVTGARHWAVRNPLPSCHGSCQRVGIGALRRTSAESRNPLCTNGFQGRAACGSRTHDLRITSASLWPTELRRRMRRNDGAATSVAAWGSRTAGPTGRAPRPPGPTRPHRTTGITTVGRMAAGSSSARNLALLAIIVAMAEERHRPRPAVLAGHQGRRTGQYRRGG